jgi:hypothetical protein
MKGHKKYDVNDSKDLKQLNQLLRQAGVTFQHNLLGVYVLVDLDHYNLFTKRKAGRRTVVTPAVKASILQYRYEGMKITDIAARTHLSIGTVHKVLKEHPEEDDCIEGQMSFDDL